jgi:hypothetical protein
VSSSQNENTLQNTGNKGWDNQNCHIGHKGNIGQHRSQLPANSLQLQARQMNK